MASVLQDPEIQFAQRLASNERSVRTKALKKLRKYFNVRSQNPKGGFTSDELLKIWKGLFYCLWMQDKPLLQEELCTQISDLVHSFRNIDTQFLFLESFLQTINREWNGIDRLRLDKFYTLVRFVFRQAFEMMKRREWDVGLVGRFTELLSAQVLRSTSQAPRGVQYHVLDVYLAELAKVGAVQLTAEQNLTFLEPFCKVAVKTKDRDLLQAVYSSVFHEIVDQAPFAIEDLMREVREGGGSDQETESTAVPNRPGNAKQKQLNGVIVAEEDDDDEEEEDDLSHLEEDVPQDGEGIGPMLQFDYKALGDRLFEMAGRSNTPTFNRKKLYGLVKIFRDLSEGVFPRDAYPEEVSTDEDDEMFGSRKRLRKRRKNREEESDEEEEGSVPKKRKGKKDGKKPAESGQNRVTGAADSADTPSDTTAGTKKKKKRRRKKQKKEEEKKGTAEEEVKEAGGQNGPIEAVVSEEQTAAETAEAPDRGEEQAGEGASGSTQNQSPGGQDAPAHTQPESQSDSTAADGSTGQDKAKRKRRRKRKSSTREEEGAQEAVTGGAEPSAAAAGGGEEEESQSVPVEEGPGPHAMPTSPGTNRKRNRNRKKKNNNRELSAEAAEQTQPGVEPSADVSLTTDSSCADVTLTDPSCADVSLTTDSSCADLTLTDPSCADVSLTTDSSCADVTLAVSSRAEEQPGAVSPDAQPKRRKRKKSVMKQAQEGEAMEGEAAQINGHAEEEAGGKKAKQSSEADALSSPTGPSKPLKKKMKKKKAKAVSGTASDFITFQSPSIPKPLFCRRAKGSPRTPTSRKQSSLTPLSESKKVTFGLKNNKTAEFKKTDRSLMVSPDGSSRVPFDPQQRPRVGVLKSPARPPAAKGKGKKSSAPAPKGRPRAADFF